MQLLSQSQGNLKQTHSWSIMNVGEREREKRKDRQREADKEKESSNRMGRESGGNLRKKGAN